jgi:hypothetical protein
MDERITVDERLREVARARIKRRRDFFWHLVTYLIINGLLIFVWAIGPREAFWPMWLLIFWGIGLAFHAWYALSRQETTEADVQAELRRMGAPDRGADSEQARRGKQEG